MSSGSSGRDTQSSSLAGARKTWAHSAITLVLIQVSPVSDRSTEAGEQDADERQEVETTLTDSIRLQMKKMRNRSKQLKVTKLGSREDRNFFWLS